MNIVHRVKDAEHKHQPQFPILPSHLALNETGIVGFGRFGQFIGKSFSKYGRVVGTSRSDYTEIAESMGATYIPLSDPEAFLAQGLDVIVFAVSIMSFESTVQSFVPHIQNDLEQRRAAGVNGVDVKGPLIVDVLSVKEHARQVLLDLLPEECDILCTHPMFGPDSVSGRAAAYIRWCSLVVVSISRAR